MVDFFRRSSNLPLVKDYLVAVQKSNILEVNEALNGLLIEEEDFEALKHRWGACKRAGISGGILM